MSPRGVQQRSVAVVLLFLLTPTCSALSGVVILSPENGSRLNCSAAAGECSATLLFRLTEPMSAENASLTACIRCTGLRRWGEQHCSPLPALLEEDGRSGLGVRLVGLQQGGPHMLTMALHRGTTVVTESSVSFFVGALSSPPPQLTPWQRFATRVALPS